MRVKVDPNLMKELKAFGLTDATKCFHCGFCTATCPLSKPGNPFPRKLIKYAQMGLRDKILKSPEPWLCYYCGDCSDTCPRGADPGEAMMVLRRYLTSQYDWTGFSRRFYSSRTFGFIAFAAVSILVGLALWLFHADNPNMAHAHLNSVWPASVVEIADLCMAAVFAFLLLSNSWRCIKFTMGDLLHKIPLRIYISQAKEFIIHFITQKRFGECTDRMQWIIHLLIMTGYSTAFILVAVFLAGGIEIIGLAWEPLAFQRDVIYPFYHPMCLLGYYATVALLFGTTYAIIGRRKKRKAVYKNSHWTDWMFLILLNLTAVTGILIHFAHLLDWPMTTYILYVIHLMVAVPILLLVFTKWSHLAFRPLVIYLTKVIEKYQLESANLISCDIIE